MTRSFSHSPARLAALFLLGLTLGGGTLRAQQRPTVVEAEQATRFPYTYSGKLRVSHGGTPYFGTATYIRRLTILTAGHLLYQPATGFSTDVQFVGNNGSYTPSVYFATLSGYQAVAGTNSDASFAQDMGYLLVRQADNGYPDVWASWAAAPDALTASGPFLALGYAAEHLDGKLLASVQPRTSYEQRLAPALYENTSYYSEEGMSGGPVYSLAGGRQTVLAVTVAGTSYPKPALSAVRAITPTEATLLASAEYDHKLITGGVINGPDTVAPGGKIKFNTGVIFFDKINDAVTSSAYHYDDTKLVAQGPYRPKVGIVKRKPGKYVVTFAADIPTGTQIPLRLFRTALPQRGQTALRTVAVTVQ